MEVKSFARCESKYVLTSLQKEKLFLLIKDKIVKDRYNLNSFYYTISNIYFDTKDYALLRHSTSNPYFKEKFRIRCYDETITDNSLIYVEIKKKLNGIVTKRRIKLFYKEALELINNPLFFQNKLNIRDFLDKQISQEVINFLVANKLEAKYFIKYKRMAYYLLEDENIRITFDFDILTNKIIANKYENTIKLIPNDMYLMEIKNPGAMPIFLAKILSELKIFPINFSKVGRSYLNNYEGVINYVKNYEFNSRVTF